MLLDQKTITYNEHTEVPSPETDVEKLQEQERNGFKP